MSSKDKKKLPNELIESNIMDASEHQGKHEDDSLSCIDELPKVKPVGEPELAQYKGFWLFPSVIKAIAAIETQYQPLPSDIILASFPKTGTTWLKALTFTILNFHKSNQTCATQTDDPLVTKNPHELVPFLELRCFGDDKLFRKFDINQMTSPRVFHTHLPYSCLPDNVKNSSCKMVYIARNPMDTLIAYWKFFYQKPNCNVPIEEAFANFCQGVVKGGPYFDHVLEYWKACKEKPEAMFFLTFEELKREPDKHVKRLAEYLGCSLDPKEIEQVVWRCSFERLSKLDVNNDPSNVLPTGVDYSAFFRKGVVGDSRHYLTPEMVKQLRELARQKWEGYGLNFQGMDQMLE